MDPPFPILCLPQLAIAEVFNSLELKEQIVFALCSQRAGTVFKCLRNKKLNPKILIDDDNCIRYATTNDQDQSITDTLFCLKRYYYLAYGRLEKVKIGGNLMNMWIKKDYSCLDLTISWENDTMKILRDYISDLFGVRIHKLIIPNEGAQMFATIFESSIDTLHYYDKSNKISSRELSDLLSNSYFELKTELFIHYWPRGFKLNDRHQTNFDLFIMTGAYWVTIENLMGFDCIEIKIRQKWFSNEELNQFLIHWINGGHPRLRCFFADVEDYNQQLALKGIHVQEVEERERIYQSLSTQLRFENLQIRRNDGVVASIKYFEENESFAFGV